MSMLPQVPPPTSNTKAHLTLHQAAQRLPRKSRRDSGQVAFCSTSYYPVCKSKWLCILLRSSGSPRFSYHLFRSTFRPGHVVVILDGILVNAYQGVFLLHSIGLILPLENSLLQLLYQFGFEVPRHSLCIQLARYKAFVPGKRIPPTKRIVQTWQGYESLQLTRTSPVWVLWLIGPPSVVKPHLTWLGTGKT